MVIVISLVSAVLWVGQSSGSDGELIPLEPSKPAAPVENKPPFPAVNQPQPTTASPIAQPEAAKGTVAPGYTDPGDWLVDLARHHGHLLGRTDPRKASLRVLALLEAAKSVSPSNADASFWSFDILSRIGRSDAAMAALRDYTRLNPSDDAARLRLTELELVARQTAPERADYIQGILKTGGLTRIGESDLRARLGEYYYERRENEPAAAEIERALRLNPL